MIQHRKRLDRTSVLLGARQVLEDPTGSVEAIVIGPAMGVGEALQGARVLRQTMPAINLVLVAEEATPIMLWCSATQYRV